MRTFILNVLPLIFLASAAMPGRGAAAETDFVAWALDRSNECDERWSIIAGNGDSELSSSLGREIASSALIASGVKITSGTKLSHSIITNRSFTGVSLNNDTYLPLSTRERNGASRGVSRLSNPAQAHYAGPYDMKRPLNSSVQQKNFFRSYNTSVARPRLNSFGRRSSVSHRLHSGATVRPTYRASRPRIL
jgi:hypothetical protein